MKFYIAIAALTCSIVVCAYLGYREWTRTEPVLPPLDLTALSNAEYIKAMGGDPVTVVPGCPFFSGESNGFRMVIYFDEKAPEDAVRITGVCVPAK